MSLLEVFNGYIEAKEACAGHNGRAAVREAARELAACLSTAPTSDIQELVESLRLEGKE